ncbi:MAG: type IV pilus modification PilV family protein [Gammaproteobacteria bacterium]
MLTRGKDRGFTAIETLVALGLMLAGIAGATALLLQDVQHERESAARRAAIRLAASLAEELRAMRQPDGRPLPPDAPVIAAWSAMARASLPEGAVAHVDADGAAPTLYRITIEWPVAGLGDQRLTFAVTT